MDETFLSVLVDFRQFAHVFLLLFGLLLGGRGGRLLLEGERFGRLLAHSSQMEVNEVPHHPRLQKTYGDQTVDSDDLRVEVSFGDIKVRRLMNGKAVPEGEHRQRDRPEADQHEQRVPQFEAVINDLQLFGEIQKSRQVKERFHRVVQHRKADQDSSEAKDKVNGLVVIV